MIESSPPFQHYYGALVQRSAKSSHNKSFFHDHSHDHTQHPVIKECELPLIDLDGLRSCNERERLACCEEICKAASEWGFFQVVNHGINPDLLKKMRKEQVKLFDMPFEKKAKCGILNNSYRWGTPTATHPYQFSWSEAFHIPLSKISEPACWGDFTSFG